MRELLHHPAVQAGVAPFVLALIVALALGRARLGGLAIVAAFATAVYLIADFNFSPLTVTRKIILLGMAAPIVGILADFAFKPTRAGGVMLALASAAATLWVFWPVLAQRETAQAWLLAGTVTVATAGMVGFSQIFLSEHPIRAGSAGLGLGLGAGIASILGGSANYATYGIALGAGAGAFLLPQMLTGRKIAAGTTFVLPATLTAGLIAAGAMVLAQVQWYSVLMLALVPVAARLPLPAKAALWLQAVLASLYTLIVAGLTCAIAWQLSRGTAG